MALALRSLPQLGRVQEVEATVRSGSEARRPPKGACNGKSRAIGHLVCLLGLFSVVLAL